MVSAMRIWEAVMATFEVRMSFQSISSSWGGQPRNESRYPFASFCSLFDADSMVRNRLWKNNAD